MSTNDNLARKIQHEIEDESYKPYGKRPRRPMRRDVELEDGEVLPDYPVGPADQNETGWIPPTEYNWR